MLSGMARPYADPVEIITQPIPATSPFIPPDSKIVVGVVAPASPDPIPIVLLPGFEYRLREWRHPDTHEIYWRLERRKAAQFGDREEEPGAGRDSSCRSPMMSLMEQHRAPQPAQGEAKVITLCGSTKFESEF